MRIYRKIEDFSSEHPVVLSLGNFDGLHRGHQHILSLNRQKSLQWGAEAVVLTFHPHPLSVFRKDEFIPLSDEGLQKQGLVHLGIDHWILEPFSPSLMAQSHVVFFERLKKNLNLKAIVVGEDFCFGSQRKGTIEYLREESIQGGFEVIVPPTYLLEGVRVSSSAIRDFLKNGEVEKAHDFLGHPYRIQGPVEKGEQRGRLLGFPTANLSSPLARNLKKGVYRTRVCLRDQVYMGVTNVGNNPTFETEGSLKLETHILDLSEDLYGQNLLIEFLGFIRPEKKFSSPSELMNQIKEDIKHARSI